jgi:hypothetical protein
MIISEGIKDTLSNLWRDKPLTATQKSYAHDTGSHLYDQSLKPKSIYDSGSIADRIIHPEVYSGALSKKEIIKATNLGAEERAVQGKFLKQHFNIEPKVPKIIKDQTSPNITNEDRPMIPPGYKQPEGSMLDRIKGDVKDATRGPRAVIGKAIDDTSTAATEFYNQHPRAILAGLGAAGLGAAGAAAYRLLRKKSK